MAPWSPAEHDNLIQTVSLRLRNRVRGADEVVHMGEQSFAVLLVAAGTPEARHRRAAAAAGPAGAPTVWMAG